MSLIYQETTENIYSVMIHGRVQHFGEHYYNGCFYISVKCGLNKRDANSLMIDLDRCIYFYFGQRLTVSPCVQYFIAG